MCCAECVMCLDCLMVCCRRYLYEMTSKWLKGGSDYKLDKLYVWNAGEASLGSQPAAGSTDAARHTAVQHMYLTKPLAEVDRAVSIRRRHMHFPLNPHCHVCCCNCALQVLGTRWVCTTPPRAGLTARSPTLSRHTTRQSMADELITDQTRDTQQRSKQAAWPKCQ